MPATFAAKPRRQGAKPSAPTQDFCSGSTLEWPRKETPSPLSDSHKHRQNGKQPCYSVRRVFGCNIGNIFDSTKAASLNLITCTIEPHVSPPMSSEQSTSTLIFRLLDSSRTTHSIAVHRKYAGRNKRRQDKIHTTRSATAVRGR